MANTGKIASLLVLLVLLFIAIGWVASYDVTSNSKQSASFSSSGYHEVFLGNKAIPEKRVIVSDRFVGELDKDARIVTISTNGNAYDVRNGVVLVDETVIKVNEDEYSVRRLDKERFSVSTN